MYAMQRSSLGLPPAAMARAGANAGGSMAYPSHLRPVFVQRVLEVASQ